MPCRHPSLLIAVLVAMPAASAQSPNYGRAIAASGSDLFVGQPLNWYGPGTVYTYRVDASGRWQEQSRLIAADSGRMDSFGHAIAVDENFLAIGAPEKGDGAGRVYTFSRRTSNAAWEPSTPLSTTSGGAFGSTLVATTNGLLVGAPGAMGHGAVHLFTRSGNALSGGTTLTPIDTAGVEKFGTALSVSGDWLLIGAPDANANAGMAYVVHRDTDGSWGAPAPLGIPAALTGTRARLGAAVLLDGDRGYVGAPGSGVVITLERTDSTWRVTGLLQPYDGGRGTGFGAAIARVGSETWVGAPNANRGNGYVYRYLMNAVGEATAAVRVTADSADGTNWPFQFGYSIASTDDRAFVGMPMRDFGEGRVLVTARTDGAWQTRQLLTGEIAVLGGGAATSAKCENGRNGVYTCNNVEVLAHLPTAALGGARGAWVNDVWGWTDPETNRDYALVARRDGASFVDVTNPAAPRVVGDLPRTAGSPPSVWRDIKVANNHAYIVADGSGAHGMQVFDLTRLRQVRGTPVVFTPDTTYHEVFSAHNVVANPATGFLYVVGSNSGGETCGGGLHMVDARTPDRPVFAGCYHSPAGSARGYTHDAQCVVYHGPDSEHRGREICVGSNESEINIADVTDKAHPRVLGRNSYPNVVYAHQGWFDAEQRYFYMNDENDEAAGKVEGTRTIVWDLTDLDDPVVANMYFGPVNSSDHNLFVVGNRVFESNYGSGLRVLDISDRAHPREVAFFDSAPLNDDGPGHSATQSGAWSNYPFFKSGIVVFTSVREGLFIVKVQDLVP
ncbi:MAG TPA: choice-of-anchor B family protein [Gemmatimonadales bacterium]|nr:choice-of-anchor B family protein [Gemmatimonadales bacterium]